MRPLVQWSIDHRWIVIGLSALLFAAGAWTARRMPIDVFPDLTAPTVTILAEGRGMAPEEMESLVTFPLESAINGRPLRLKIVGQFKLSHRVGSSWT